MKNVAVAAVLCLSGCAALRTGWVQVEYVNGEPKPLMVCKFTVKRDNATRDTDVDAVCVEWPRRTAPRIQEFDRE